MKKGQIMSEEQKKKIAISVAKNHPRAFLGRKHTFETIEKMRLAKVGKKFTNIHKEKLRLRKLGIPLKKEHKEKIRLAHLGKHTGEKSNFWKGGLSSQIILIRASNEYKLWRKAVFDRDNYTCIWCGQHGGKLQADHIKPFSKYPALRFAIDNGRTLCRSCHRKTETYGGKSRWNS